MQRITKVLLFQMHWKYGWSVLVNGVLDKRELNAISDTVLYDLVRRVLDEVSEHSINNLATLAILKILKGH